VHGLPGQHHVWKQGGGPLSAALPRGGLPTCAAPGNRPCRRIPRPMSWKTLVADLAGWGRGESGAADPPGGARLGSIPELGGGQHRAAQGPYRFLHFGSPDFARHAGYWVMQRLRARRRARSPRWRKPADAFLVHRRLSPAAGGAAGVELGPRSIVAEAVGALRGIAGESGATPVQRWTAWR